MVTADHGNAEQMKNPDTGAPHTAHTTNPVPFIMAGKGKELRFKDQVKSNKMGAHKEGDGEEDEEEGALCDVAPTILDVMVCPTL